MERALLYEWDDVEIEQEKMRGLMIQEWERVEKVQD
jgi:hypothetical protein